VVKNHKIPGSFVWHSRTRTITEAYGVHEIVTRFYSERYHISQILFNPKYFIKHKDSGIFPYKKMDDWNKRVEKICEKRFTFSSHELLSSL
jgi:hypothetical protein